MGAGTVIKGNLFVCLSVYDEFSQRGEPWRRRGSYYLDKLCLEKKQLSYHYLQSVKKQRLILDNILLDLNVTSSMKPPSQVTTLLQLSGSQEGKITPSNQDDLTKTKISLISYSRVPQGMNLQNV